MTCRAPQTREYWRGVFVSQTDADVLSNLRAAERGLSNHGKTSSRHRHDWTIYRNSCLREARRRGIL